MSLQPNWSQTSVTDGTLYLQQDDDDRPVAVSDIAQGQIGDCFFLAALGEIAIKDPAFIANHLITGDENGDYTVNLYNYSSGESIPAADNSGDNFYGFYAGYFSNGSKAPHGFEPMPVSVNQDQFSPDAVNNYNTQDIINGTKEIWPQVIEQAYLSNLPTPLSGAGGGNSENAFEALTGQTAYWGETSQMTSHTIANLSKSGALLTFNTPSTGDQLPFNLIANHEYSFEKLKIADHQAYVQLYNPWGNNQPDPIPFSQFATVLPQFVVGKI